MRGEHPDDIVGKIKDDGSSPHAWGTLRRTGLVRPPIRFIPTCVGNTTWGMDLSYQESVHPHMRGEHPTLRRSPYCANGSSPHAWGTLEVLNPRTLYGRFIPTCVGNTVPLVSEAGVIRGSSPH